MLHHVVVGWLAWLAAAAGGPPGGNGGAEEPILLRGPYLQALLDTSVLVCWNTDLPSIGRVECEEAGLAPLSAVQDEPVDAHRVRLEGLRPGARYRYRIFDGDRLLAGDFGFRTSPGPGGGPVRLAVLGDSGTPGPGQSGVAAAIAAMEPDLVLHTGDLDYIKGQDSIDATLFGPFGGVFARAGFYAAKGNHLDWAIHWDELFVPPEENPEGISTYYSFDWGEAHFIVLDSTRSLREDSFQIEWLLDHLEASRGRRPWTILCLHDPVYTVGAKSYWVGAALQDLRDRIAGIADRYGIDLVLSGHDHNYQRTHPVRAARVRDAWQGDSLVSPRGTVYVITGGGGGTLYWENPDADHRFTKVFRDVYHAVELEIDAGRLSVRAVSSEGEVIDAFSIMKGEPPPEFRFIRGDADGSGLVDLADAVAILQHLFAGRPADCPPTLDTTGSGSPTITDGIRLLSYLFLGESPPPPPFPACGADPAVDDGFCYRTACAGG